MRIAALLDHWRNRPRHERWLIGAPVAALAAAIAYLGVIEPLAQARQRLERALPAIGAREARIRAQVADVRANPVAGSNAVARTGNAQAVVTATQAAIERHRLRTASPTVDRADDARVRVAFARVPFHAVWPLFQDLQSQLGIRVVALRIDRIDSTLARVEATLASGESR
jgi:type II secretory pathway component PulM